MTDEAKWVTLDETNLPNRVEKILEHTKVVRDEVVKKAEAQVQGLISLLELHAIQEAQRLEAEGEDG